MVVRKKVIIPQKSEKSFGAVTQAPYICGVARVATIRETHENALCTNAIRI